MIQQRFWLIQFELHQAVLKARILFAQNRVAANEVFFVLFDRKTKTRLKNMILSSNVMAKVPEAFFNPAGIHHVHPA